MRTNIVMLLAAVSSLCFAPLAQAQSPFGVTLPPEVSGPSTPVTVTGRVVTEDGQPVANVAFMIPPTPGRMGLPQVMLFQGVPAKCFTFDGGGEVRTDSTGRYRFTARFHPQVEVGTRKCSEYRSRMTRANLNLVPLPDGGHEFRVATGPLPMPRANVPAAGLKPQKTLPKGSFDPSAIRR